MTYKVRRNATTDSRAFVAACEAFSSERHPVVRPSIRVQQPPGGVSTVEFGHSDAAQETEALMKIQYSRPGSDSRKSEMYGSVSRRTDSGNGENNGAREAGMRIHQPADGFSQRSFQIGGEESALLDRLITIPAATRPMALATPLIRSTSTPHNLTAWKTVVLKAK